MLRLLLRVPSVCAQVCAGRDVPNMYVFPHRQFFHVCRLRVRMEADPKGTDQDTLIILSLINYFFLAVGPVRVRPTQSTNNLHILNFKIRF